MDKASFRRKVRATLYHDVRVQTIAAAFSTPLALITAIARLRGDTSPLSLAVSAAASAGIVLGALRGRCNEYAAQSLALGIVTAIGALVCATTSSLAATLAARYVLVMCVFHFSEALATGITNADSLKPDSFLLNHSLAYWLAAIASWLEFGMEVMAAPALKCNALSWLGVLMCVGGELLRKAAMWQANTAFTHRIAARKAKGHALVTTGVYGCFRHPGYVGWFAWSVGTQLILCNPLCAIGYAYVTYRFFEDRIYDEERYLVEFYGRRYLSYQNEVPIGILGISGYTPPPTVASAYR